MTTSATSSRIEQARIMQAYARRRARVAAGEVDALLYTAYTPGYLFSHQLLERRAVKLLSEAFGRGGLSTRRVLDIGCGDGVIGESEGVHLHDLVRYGANPDNLYGVDLQRDLVERGLTLAPGLHLVVGSADDLPFENESFDLVCQSTVFSSVLDPTMRRRIASEMRRVLKPDGVVLWYDVRVNNPRNPDLRRVSRREIADLFPDCEGRFRSVTLAHPIARRLAARGFLAPCLLERFPPLRTHWLVMLQLRGNGAASGERNATDLPSTSSPDTAATGRPTPRPFVDVVCLPDMDWDHVLWTNRQHVMYRLPRVAPEARVLYVAPPRFVLAGRVGRRRRLVGREFPEGQRSDGRWTTRIGDRLWVLQPPLPVPSRLATRLAPRLVDAWSLRTLRRTMGRLGFDRPVLWTYTPLADSLRGRLDERLLIYDVVDDYSSIPEYARLGPNLAERDRDLTASADLVFASSLKVYEERLALNPRTLHVGNAADIDLFLSARAGEHPEPPGLRDIPRPRIGFHGAITPWKLDLDLLEGIARARPDWSLVLIGPVEDPSTARRLTALGSTWLVGAREQADLPAYLAHLDACLIPYRRTPYTERLQALKLYECLAAGRPVVATDLPCFVGVDGVETASDVTGFVRALGAALAAPPAAPPVDSLSGLGWDEKARRLWSAVLGALQEKESSAT